MSRVDQRVEEILEHYSSIVNSEPNRALLEVEEMTKHPRYEEDKHFKMACLYLMSEANFKIGYNTLAHDYASKALKIELDEDDTILYSLVYKALGNTYAIFELYTLAIDSYLTAINYNQKNSIPNLNSLLLSNIGVLYHNLDNLEFSLEYYNRAIQAYNASLKSPYTSDLYGVIKNNILINIIDRGDFDQATLIQSELEELKKASKAALLSSYMVESKVKLLLAQNRFDDALEYFQLMISETTKDFYQQTKIDSTIELAKFAMKHGSDYQLIINLLDFLIELDDNSYSDLLLSGCMLLSESYLHIGDIEKFKLTSERYVHLVEIANQKNIERDSEALDMVIDIYESKLEMALLSDKNEELNRKNDDLTKALNHLKIINEIGLEMTSTHSISVIVSKLYTALSKHIDASTVFIGAVELDLSQINIIGSIEEGTKILLPPVSFNHKESFMVKSYHSQQSIYIPDVEKTMSSKEISKHNKTNLRLRTLFFCPLFYRKKIIGIYSVQSTVPDAYSKLDIEFFEGLSHYVAIALANTSRLANSEEQVERRVRSQNNLESVNKKLAALAEQDGLTKVNNRSVFDNRITSFINAALSQNKFLAMLMIDIDDFKAFNDSYGHLKGDEVLVGVASALNDFFLLDSMLFARYGGEEFIGLTITDSIESVVEMANEMCQKVYQLKIEHNMGTHEWLTISIGVSAANHFSNKLGTDLLKQADIALYSAKSKGKNQVVLFKL